MTKQESKGQNRTRTAKKQMLAALEKSLGIVTVAIRNTGFSRTQYYQWLKEDEEFAQQVKDIDNITIDFAEAELYKQIKNGNPTSTIFFLKTKGKHRGYVERIETTGVDGEPINHKHEVIVVKPSFKKNNEN